MARRSLLAVSCVLVFWHVGSASAKLVGWWPLDEGSGNVTKDGSGQANNGTIVGTPVWAPGQIGGALQLNGSTYVNCGTSQVFSVTDAVTLAAWIQPDPTFAYPDWSGIIMRGGPNIDTFALYYNGTSKQMGFKTTGTTPNWFASGANSATAMFDNEWHHVAATYDGATKIIYLDGNRLANAAATGKIETSSGRLLLGAGRDLTPATHHAVGKLDDAQIYDEALSEAQIRRIMEGLADKSVAKEPAPEDGAVDVPFDVVLRWTPGDYAATHDVYFGTTFIDVNSAGRVNPAGLLASQSQTAAEFAPAGLEYGQTYFWRIDEVNAAPDNTIFKGQTWSFTVEPYAYPLTTGVTATASSSQPNMGPQNTINGSGLDAKDHHSTDSTHMWMTTNAKPHWIQYEFDKVYKLDSLWVWNSNQMIEGFVGFGAKDVAVEYSTDGATWTALEGVPEFAKASGTPIYTAGTVVDFNGVMAKFVKLTVNTNWGGATPQTGLSEVRFFYVPLQARQPRPADGAANVAVDADLAWRSGREAKSHEVYLGVDRNAMVLAATVANASFTPAAMTFGTKYFWKVNEAGDGGTHEGDLWSFTTQEFAVIDDMEAYNDDDNRIYNAWLDGVATKASGSTVGYFQAPFAERTIIHGGAQSMPFEYNNTAAPFYSEAEQEFATAQNWSVNGADTLSLWVRGNPAGYVDNGGTVTMTAAGHDIWDNADDFRFAFKTLTGDGSILVKVESLVNTNNWAKAGVMIRQDLTDSSKFAYFIQSFNQGVSLGWRQMTSGTCGSATQTGVAAPRWVKLIRKGDVFTAQYSADGKTWTDLKNADGTVASTTVAMTNPVYIGLCVTSHNTTATTTAVMSGAATTGTVSGSWQVQAIGDDPQLANDPADLYVTVQDSAGKKATATHATAVNAGVWTQWQIPLSSFTGLNLKSVKKLIVGVDSRTSPTKGAGMLFIDDIGFGHPAQ